MKLGLRGRLFVISFGLIALSVIIAYGLLRNELEQVVTERIEDDLVVRAELLAERTEQLGENGRWDELADQLGKRSQSRVTLIRSDGVVLGDSALDASAVSQMDNHKDRPEVRAALAGERGVSQRRSSTLGEELLYVAVPFHADGEVAGVARVALRLTEVVAAVDRLKDILTFAFVLALGVAVVMSSIAAELATRNARLLTAAAKKMAAGDLDARSNLRGTDEFAELGRTVDRLADGLSKSMGELRHERDRMEGVLDGMQEGVLLVDGDDRITMVNPMLRETLLLGADAVGERSADAIGDTEIPRLLELARDTGESVSSEISVTGISPRRLLAEVTPLKNQPGTLLAVFFDVTELRRLESLRRDFVANVSHELRTPVTAIQSAAETLKLAGPKDPKMGEQFIDMIERNAERLKALVEDLLTLSRVESKEWRLAMEPLDLVPVVEDAFATFADRAEAERVELRSDIEGAPRVSADQRAVEHVLTNLVENAVKYSGEGSTVTVAVTEADGCVRIAVRDTGPGIEEKHLPRLFERFYRADPGRSRDKGGTGLGLAIVKHLVEAMDGQVSVESKLGEGSEFSFTLAKATDAGSVHAA